MTRKTPLRPLLGATAVAAALSACSQPPGAALVDLSGTYGQTAYATPNQPYAGPIPSIQLNEVATVYQPTVAYQPAPVVQQVALAPAPAPVIEQTVLTYQDAPVSQVASLDHGIGYTAPDLKPGYYAGAPEPINVSPFSAPHSAIEVQPLGTLNVVDIGQYHGSIASDAAPSYKPIYTEPVKPAYTEPVYSQAAPVVQGYGGAPSVDFSYHGHTTTYRAPAPEAVAYRAPQVYDGGSVWGGAPAPAYVPPAALPRPQTPVAAPYPVPYDLPGYGSFPPEGYLGDAVSALRASTFSTASYRVTQPAPGHPMPAHAPHAYVPANAPAYGTPYVIRHGDTMYGIAKRHGIKVDDLAAANNLGLSATIYPGQAIVLPGVVTALAPAPALPQQPVMAPVAHSPGPAVTYGEPMPQVVYNAQAPTNVAFETGSIGSAGPSFGWPVHGQVYARKDAHGSVGLEIRTAPGTPVAASGAGEVRHVQDGPQGILVVIDHDGGWRSLYLGLDNVGVQPGQPVGAGAPLGVVAAQQTASVLFELRKNGIAIDPVSQLKK